jgi:histidine ammonia-lyase
LHKRDKLNKRKLVIGGKNLGLSDVVGVARNYARVELAPGARKKILRARAVIDEIEESGRVEYGITTGFGALKGRKISVAQVKQLQKNLVESHAAGVGRALLEDVVRAAMLIRASSLARGYSGVRPVVVETLVEMLNKRVLPFIPEKGSVGSSGDLVPLSHLALVLIGSGKAFYKGAVLEGGECLKKAGITPIELEAKEGLSLINGTAVMTAIACLAVHDALLLAENADVAAAMSVEALMGTDEAFDARIHRARPHKGQIACAGNMRELTAKSALMSSHESCERIQDAYSLRCIPQVHGASRDAIDFARRVVETELNSVTDNPLVFGKKIFCGGNFHGQPVALAMDLLGIAVCELGDISERRTARLLDPKLNEGLPPFLVENSGLNSGYMIAQYTAAALVSENKVLAHPASVDSIPTSGNQEDHVSMGTIAARKAAGRRL